ncbi:MAG: TIGR02452 family protein [Lachnospiraceae bacterium]|nr:TIGR02452 family protein [Lachnospiraceae bacterium]
MGFFSGTKNMLKRPGNIAQFNEIESIIGEYRRSEDEKKVVLDTDYNEMSEVMVFTPELFYNLETSFPAMAQAFPTYDCEIKVVSADTFDAAGGDLTPVSVKKKFETDEETEAPAGSVDEISDADGGDASEESVDEVLGADGSDASSGASGDGDASDGASDSVSDASDSGEGAVVDASILSDGAVADASNSSDGAVVDAASAESTELVASGEAEVHENISEYKTLVLNFASGAKPGGGVESGASAQEEALCRRSTLYASISSETANEMYRMNRLLGPVDYLDYMLLSPSVTVMFDTKFKLLENPFKTAVLTAPAVPLNRDGIKIPNDYVRYVMRKRIRNIMRISAMNGYDRLVLGAWGCGAYGHDAMNIATYFREILIDEDYKKFFKEIVFAIYAKDEKKDYNFQTFSKLLAPDYVKEPPKFIGFLQPNKEYGFLSNSFRCEFTDNNGVKYTSVDQYLMYQKALTFNDEEAAKRIIAVNDPAVVRDFGRKVRNYDDEIWKGKRQLILNDAIQMKFSQNAGLQGMLVNTGDALLAECNPHEATYGIGVSIFTKGIDNKENWDGANLTGHTLMNYRDKVKGTYSV